MGRGNVILDAEIKRKKLHNQGMGIFVAGAVLSLLIGINFGQIFGLSSMLIFWVVAMNKMIKMMNLDNSGVFDCSDCGRSFLQGFGNIKSVAYLCKHCGFNPHKPHDN